MLMIGIAKRVACGQGRTDSIRMIFQIIPLLASVSLAVVLYATRLVVRHISSVLERSKWHDSVLTILFLKVTA